jgi:hypothetical protein
MMATPTTNGDDDNDNGGNVGGDVDDDDNDNGGNVGGDGDDDDDNNNDVAMPPPSTRGQNRDDFDNKKNEMAKGSKADGDKNDDNNDNDSGGGTGDDDGTMTTIRDGSNKDKEDIFDDNGLIFGPSCSGACFSRATDCGHKTIKVSLNNVGDYVVFPALRWHHGYYNIQSKGTVIFQAQLFATPSSAMGSSRTVRRDIAMTSHKEGNFCLTRELKPLSDDLLHHWDDTYSADIFPPPKNFLGKIDKSKNRSIPQNLFYLVPKIEQLVYAFEEIVGGITVESVWVLQKSNDDDGFQGWHQDMKHRISTTIVVNVGVVTGVSISMSVPTKKRAATASPLFEDSDTSEDKDNPTIFSQAAKRPRTGNAEASGMEGGVSAANPPDMEGEARDSAMELMRPLTDEEMMVVEKATQGEGSLSEILVKHDADSVQRSSMWTLRPKMWLVEEVINYYFKNCLTIRDEKICARDKGRRRSHFFNSFFVQNMFDEMNDDLKLRGRYNYKMVKRWSKKVPGKDIFNLKYIFFPINLDNTHWTLAVIFMEDKQIRYYDSLAKSDNIDKSAIQGKRLCERKGCKKSAVQGKNLCHFHEKQLCTREGCFQLADVQGKVGVCVAHLKLEGLMKYVKDEYRAKKGEELDVTKWELVSCVKDTPRQRNGEFVFLGVRLRLTCLPVLFRILHSDILFLNLGFDCGVFTCMFGDFISKDCPLLFNQDHIDKCRDRIALSIMRNCAMDDSCSQVAVATATLSNTLAAQAAVATSVPEGYRIKLPVDSSPVCRDREPAVKQKATRPPGDKKGEGEGEGAAGAKQELAVFYAPTDEDKYTEYPDASSDSEDSEYSEPPKKGEDHQKPPATLSVKTRLQARKDSDRT